MKQIIEEITQDSNDPQTYAIIGTAMEVHWQLWPGFLEPVYQEALAIEFTKRNIPFQREVDIPIYYSGQKLSCTYRADFICYGEVIVELKALRQVTNIEYAQLINYLRATDMPRAVLLNFGERSLFKKRFINTLP